MKYNWKITAKKGLILFAEIIILGAIAFVTEDPEYICLLPVLEMLRNAIKHWND